MKFAHIADVHLGTQKDTPYLFEGFYNFIDYLELHPVDMIFITGDLFDHPPGKEELMLVDTQLARLQKTDILYVTGDCDYLGRDLFHGHICLIVKRFIITFRKRSGQSGILMQRESWIACILQNIM